MPRSFLIKKHCSNKKPNYSQLETQNASYISPYLYEGLTFPLIPQPEILTPIICDPPRLWDGAPISVRARLPPPLDTEIGTETPVSRQPSLEISVQECPAVIGTNTPFRDAANDLNLSPSKRAKRRATNHGVFEGDGNTQEKMLQTESTGMETLEKFECLQCHKAYNTLSGLSKHRQLHCESQTRKYFNCKYCDKEYVSLGALKMHIRTHTLPCVCKICGKAFSRPWLLQGHIRTHTGEKPFACPHCSRAFADRSNLRAHLQTHSDVKRYQCKSCSKTFSRMSLLSKHEEAGCCPMS
ncbi:zinc finger protein SNAI3 [Callorhinchus milii]|uniref:Zinc finger protein SNAI2 n=1 Tax=Callorhinchus milii TaxID=7868 RepID=A0A4W3JAB9_CALMI|nr:zinc finger protein SNAI3 [Callorhinchus milii]|eukprot:gi/632944448/ref/XP_007887515.1/ PREDICTED: zinc finger protein SNAI3 [Callorhinchus milii]